MLIDKFWYSVAIASREVSVNGAMDDVGLPVEVLCAADIVAAAASENEGPGGQGAKMRCCC